MYNLIKDQIYLTPVLDRGFVPAALVNMKYQKLAKSSGQGERLTVALVRNDAEISNYESWVFPEKSNMTEVTLLYVERLIKTLLWQNGGYKLIVGGPAYIGKFIKELYSKKGKRNFDVNFMSKVFEREFEVDFTSQENVPGSRELAKDIGGNLEGCRIGFDAGGSNKKVCALVDGRVVFSENTPWNPKDNGDPSYHYREIIASIKRAAATLPKVDCLGVSSAGVIINNRVMESSLFLKVPPENYTDKVRDIFLRVIKELGDIPMEAANDGDVAALLGAMELNLKNLLGISLGTSVAGGYVDNFGKVNGKLNELAFMPVDYNRASPVDPWSGDHGCGVSYLSQDAAVRLAEQVGIEFSEKASAAERFKYIHKLLKEEDMRAQKIYETIGAYLGYSIANYSQFYWLNNVMLSGGVTSGEGGEIILQTAQQVLKLNFPKLYNSIKLHLPVEDQRGLGQAIAAASLPYFKK